MGRAELDFGREVEQPLYYDGNAVGTRRADFIVSNHVMVEIKAQTALLDVRLAQAKNYVTAFGLKTGLLINFGAKSLEFKGVYPS